MPRPRFQFRMRTLFIVVTLAALVQPIAIIAWKASHPRTQCADLLKQLNLRIDGR